MTAPAVTEEQRANMREKKVTHWFARVVGPDTSAILELPKCDPEKLVMNFLPVEMIHGATIFVNGAQNPLTDAGQEFTAHPSPNWGKRK